MSKPADRSQPEGAERGFTLLEVIVCLAILAVIIVPLTTSFIRGLQQTKQVSSRIAQSGDAQRIGDAWTKDTQSLDKAGPNVSGVCPGKRGLSEGYPLITFNWDLGSVPTNSGQPALVPKTATWAIILGPNGTPASLLRRYCEAGVPKSEQLIASGFGLLGKSELELVHGADISTPDVFCPASGESCTIVIDGDFKYRLTAERRVPGGTSTNTAKPGRPTDVQCTAGNKLISVLWKAPDGSIPITGYRVEAWSDQSGTVAKSVITDSATLGADLAPLSNLTTYYIAVYAFNDNGDGLRSNPLIACSPAPTVPGQPDTLTLTAGPVANPLSVDAAWGVPQDDGGSTIDLYQVHLIDNNRAAVGSDITLSSRDLNIANLLPDTTYTATVRAHNGVGWGPFSDEVSANTRPPKPVVTNVQGGNGKAVIKFTLADNGNINLAPTGAVRITVTCKTGTQTPCSNVTYVVNHPTPTSPNGTATVDTSTDTTTVPTPAALLTGRTYNIRIEVQNTDGNWSPPSDLSADSTVILVGAPDVPTRMGINDWSTTKNIQFLIPPVAAPVNYPTTGYYIRNTDAGGQTSPFIPVDPENPNAVIQLGWNSDDVPFDENTNPKWFQVPGQHFDNFVTYHFAIRACNAFGCSAESAIHRGTPGVFPVLGCVTPSGPCGNSNLSNDSALKVKAVSAVASGTGFSGTHFFQQCYARTGTQAERLLTNGVTLADGQMQVTALRGDRVRCTSTARNDLPATGYDATSSYDYTDQLQLGATEIGRWPYVYDAPQTIAAGSVVVTKPASGTLRFTPTLPGNYDRGGPNATYPPSAPIPPDPTSPANDDLIAFRVNCVRNAVEYLGYPDYTHNYTEITGLPAGTYQCQLYPINGPGVVGTPTAGFSATTP